MLMLPSVVWFRKRTSINLLLFVWACCLHHGTLAQTACTGGVYSNCVLGVTSSSSFTLTSNTTAHILMIGGGGGGGSNAGGGGGAGDLIFAAYVTLPVGAYTLTIGSGGTAASQCSASGSGQNTIMTLGSSSITAYGGGNGGGSTSASSGGSGGGGASWNGYGSTTAGTGVGLGIVGNFTTTGAAIFSYGGNGATSTQCSGGLGLSAGGGGAGGPGSTGTDTIGGRGGSQLCNVIINGQVYDFATLFGTGYGVASGSSRCFAGGGGGGKWGTSGACNSATAAATGGVAGLGGGTGGISGAGAGSAGTANTGGGGGGGGDACGVGGAGGSGIVLVSFTNCPPGTYKGQISCNTCPANTYGASGVCTACPANSWSNAGAGGCTANVGYYDLGSSLMAYYPFNSNNLLADATGNLGSLTGTAGSTMPISTVSSVPYTGGQAINFVSANSQFLNIPSITIPDPYTICLYINNAGLGTGPAAYHFGNTASNPTNYVLFYENSGDSFYRFREATGNQLVGDITTDNSYSSTNTWIHYCISWNGLTGSIWKNGSPYVTNVSPTGGAVPSRAVIQLTFNYLGKNAWASSFWSGNMDEFMIFNRVLTNAEVQTIYNLQSQTGSPTIFTNCTIACSGGTVHCSPTGTAVCCTAGQYFIEGTSSTCQTCPAGTYGTGSATSCTGCPVNTTSVAGSSSCTACASNTWAGVGSPMCYSPVCQAGSYGADSGLCVQCPAGTSSALGSAGITACVLCGGNQYSAKGGLCTACPANSQSVAGAASCTANAGYYNSAGSMVLCSMTCTSGTVHCIPAGTPVCCGTGTYFVDGTSTACQTCPSGTYGYGNTTACMNCAVNTYSAAGVGACTACPTNSQSSAGAGGCTATAGNVGPVLYLFDGNSAGLSNMGSDPNMAVSVVGTAPTFSTVASKPSTYFASTTTGGYLSIPNTYSSYTAMFWINLVNWATTPPYAEIFCTKPSLDPAATGGMNLEVQTNGKVTPYACYGGTCGGGTTATTLTTGQWYHVAVTVPYGSPYTVNVYLNGVAGTGTPTATSGTLAYQSLFIGMDPADGGNRIIKASMQDFRIYNTILSSATITSIYNSGNVLSPFITCPTTVTCTSGTVRCTPAGQAVCCGAGTYFVEGVSAGCQTCAAGTYGSGNTTACLVCPANTYSPSGSSVCTACPANTGAGVGAGGCVAGSGYYIPIGARFPPSGMTSATLTTGSPSETFTASASSWWTNAAGAAQLYGAFSYSIADWTSNNAYYSTTDGSCTASCPFITVVDGVSYRGEWIQLQTGVGRQLVSYSIQAHPSSPTQAPTKFIIAGSNDGVTWTTLDSQSGIVWAASQIITFTPTPSLYRQFTYFRMIELSSGGNAMASLAEWALYAGAAPTTCVISGCTSGVTYGQCTTTGSTVCCWAGTYWIPSATSAGCTPCVAGTYGNGSATVCTPCSAGTYAASAGSSICTACASGTTSVSGSSSCPLISSGGNAAPIGQYWNGNAYVGCLTGSFCAGGSAAPQTCTICSTGKYTTSWCNATVDAQCLSCSAGSNFTNVTNATACTQCSKCNPGSAVGQACLAASDIVCAGVS